MARGWSPQAGKLVSLGVWFCSRLQGTWFKIDIAILVGTQTCYRRFESRHETYDASAETSVQPYKTNMKDEG